MSRGNRQSTSVFSLAILLALTVACVFALTFAVSPVLAQSSRPPAFLATHYDLTATINSLQQSISAVAKVDFKAQEVASTVLVELHPNLDIKDVRSANGKSLDFQRDAQNAMYVTVNLPGPVAAGSTTTLTFTYEGFLANEQNSPVPGITLASINKDGAYLLLPSRWFPLTFFPSNRYTGTFRLNVPDNFAVAGTGKSSAPTPMAGTGSISGGRLLYTFQCDTAAPNGTFVAGNLQLNPKEAEGVNVAVYAPAQQNDAKSAQAFASDIARSYLIFSDMLGPLQTADVALVQLPDGTLRDFAAPGVLLLAKHLWDPRLADRTIAQMVASQWWGNSLLPASPGDVWISDGLARYSEALYAEQNAGKEAGLKVVDEFAVGALMYEDAAPVDQAARLIPYSPDYRSVVMNKGAMIFHMLRAEMGDAAFKSLLHDFYARYSGKNASNQDFETMAQQLIQASTKPPGAPPELRGFFAQWLNSTGVPDFTLEYVVYRTAKDFRTVGKIKQPLDTFSMPVELRIDTEGNSELKTIDVVGTESPFTVETFGRPKPGGIKIDPNNVILKGSTALRARAAIARGEELAEQGRYYDAIGQYQRALSIQPNRPLANFRMGEAFFYQKNYQAAANAFREALQVVPEPSEKWTEVWGHIYLGKVFDLLGQRERAVNEYSKARQTNDDTGGAQQVVQALLKKPYSEGGATTAQSPASSTNLAGDPSKPANNIPPPASGDRPTLKRPNP